MSSKLTKHQARLAIDLFEAGIIKIETINGFKLKGHEKNPNAPLSPIYINLRFNNWKNKLPLRIGRVLYNIADRDNIEFDAIAGIPSAGIDFAKAFNLCHLIHGNHDTYPEIILSKSVFNGARKIIYTGNIPDEIVGTRILLIDDVISGGNSALEAVRAIEMAGGVVAGIVVLIDRNQGGSKSVSKKGYNVSSYLNLTDMLALYKKAYLMSEDEVKTVFEYIAS